MINNEISELLGAYTGLEQLESDENSIVISGFLAFEASYKELELIENIFELKVVIPNNYPISLPEVYSLGDHLNRNYDHINNDCSLCLAVPIELRKTFNRTPTLLGFMDNLVIPFLYGYSYWKKYGKYPFGEFNHGYQGIRDYYLRIFQTDKELALIQGLFRIFKYGYRGHHLCPCGSKKIIRKCHKDIAFEIAQPSFKHELIHDLTCIIRSQRTNLIP